jgi:DNA-directed RNA polymerase II subunit RPB2
MYPTEARLRKLTYGGNLYIDIHHKTVKIDPVTGESEIIPYDTLEKYPCGRMPIMVGSKYCVLSEQNNLTKTEMGEGIYDYGGYFIIKGSEKIIISQEKKCENKICVFKQKGAQTKYSENAEISCVHPDNPSIISPVWVKMKSKEETYGGNVIRVRLRRMKQDIPLIIIFRALNFISDKSIVELIVYNTSNENNTAIMELLKASIEEAKPIQSQKIALEYISKYITGTGIGGIQTMKYKNNKCKLKYTFDILCTELFPHVGESPIKKAYFLGYMVNKLLKCHLGIIKYDDRDSFLNKRVETSGELMAELFRINFSKFVKELKTICDKDMLAGRISELPQNLSKKLKPNSIENDTKFALSTGNWGHKNQAKARKGIAAVLQRLTYSGTLSNERRIVAPIDKNGKLTDPRKLHCTQWGVICPFETPEGGSVGIVKNMALTCQITIPCSDEPVKAYLDEFNVVSLDGVKPCDVFDSVKVFVNGDWYGQSFEPKKLVDLLRSLRRNGIINPFISIAWYIQYNEIQIWTDGGRLCRPLYIIENNKFRITDKIADEIVDKKLLWRDLIIRNEHSEANVLEDVESIKDNAILEYIDVGESDTLMIAMAHDDLLNNSKSNFAYHTYTHCEIHASLALGVLVCNVPFSDHNQAPRNLYQGAMGKQALGVYSTAFRHRMDTMGHILHYPQKPMVNTETSKYVHSSDLPSGQMPIVAIACYTGYNQEDSLIINQSAIDRGLFRSSFYRTYLDEEKKNSATLEDEKFCKPQKYYPNGKIYTEKMSYGSYDKLDNNGFVKIGSFVDGNDIIIGKVTMLKDSIEGEPKARDLSTPLRANESGIVDKVYKNSNGDGYNFVKVRVRSDRIPEVGDKFACFGQFTDVLTNKGWKKIKDLTKEDKVATLKNDNELFYENPIELMSYDCNDDLYYVKSNQVDLEVTLNHRMYIGDRNGNNYHIEEAKNIIGKRVKYLKNIKTYNQVNLENIFILKKFNDIPEKKLNLKSFLVIFGIWMAEGWTHGALVQFAAHKKRVKESLEEHCKILGYEIIKTFDKKTDNDKNRWSIKDKQLLNFFNEYSVGAINKFLPDWVWGLSMEDSKILMNSMILGDGHTMKNGTLRYDTSSEILADDFQRLCLHSGFSANKYMRYEAGHEAYCKSRDEIFKSTRDSYRLTVVKTQNNPIVNKNRKQDGTNGNDGIMKYNGKVYCCQVTSGIIYVRNNGKPVWCGNSRH